MTTASVTKIDSILQQLGGSDSPEDVINALEATLAADHDYHRLFDARLMRTRIRLGLPVTQPTSLDNVPADKQAEFRDAYVEAAREVGQLFIDDNRLTDAWAYFRTIGESEPIRSAIAQFTVPEEPDEQFDEIMNLALYEGVHMVKGLEFLLKTHGTCNSVTTLSQLQQQMTFEERRQSAALMVRQLYGDLRYSLRSDLESRNPVVSPNASIRELIKGQDVLFAEGNYHIDVSHLHSIVGFARSLTKNDPELEQAIELCEYGSRLSEPLRYPGNPPFEDYYEAHRRFLNGLAGHGAPAALQWFVDRMQAESDENNKRLTAFVILDLGQRTDQEDTALNHVAFVLNQVEDPGGFSFTSLCVEQNRLDLLERTAVATDDVIAWATAKLSAAAD